MGVQSSEMLLPQVLQILAIHNVIISGQEDPSPDCHWPNADPEKCDAQPVCPDCEKVVCEGDIQPGDCPKGTFFEAKKLFGCCPACVAYLEYAEPCVGLTTNGMLNYKGTESGVGHEDDYPLNFVEETDELPCSKVKITDKVLPEPLQLTERVLRGGVTFYNSATVPIIQATRCAPGLECRIASYVQPTTTPTTATTITTTTTTKPTPGREVFDGSIGSPMDGFNGPIGSPINGGVEDPYPICNVPAPEETSESLALGEWMDCVNRPCDCRRVDYKLWEAAGDCTRHEWKPTCTETGVFQKLQLRESRNSQYSPNYMWCSNPNGERLFGAARPRQGEEEGMTCSCSRKRWELEQEKAGEDFHLPARDDVSLHCNDFGNFEELQCDNGNCWCVLPQTGKAVSTVVPESLVKLLPCFNGLDEDILEENFGSQYLRKCESRAIKVAKTQANLRAHGTSWSPSSIYNCDFDGSFGPVHQYPTETRCQNSHGKDDVYAAPNEEAADMNCQCFRDLSANMPGVVNCQGNGNYPTYQKSNGKEWCVDQKTGWRGSNAVDATKKCCLDSEKLPSLYLWGPQGHSEFKCRSGSEDTCDPCEEEMKICME